MKTPTENHVNKQLPYLPYLADCLLNKPVSSAETLVVPFVGAGASASAGIPASGALQKQLYDAFSDKTESISKILDEEAISHFPLEAKNGIQKLSLFRFSSIISRFAYGRKLINEHISTAMRSASHRPLAYEHLAHLVKHEFIDHFVVLNYDELLDEALEDEVPDRLRFITSPDEVPGPRSIRDSRSECCYLFKPFGSLSTDNYKLEPDDITRYGSESIWRFMLDNIFRPKTGDNLPNIIIILIGYAAAEPAFEQLMAELTNDPNRNISIFIIDSRDNLPNSLKKLKTIKKCQVRHIKLQADLGIDLLLRLMKIKYLSVDENKVWTPVARHRIISALRYIDITTPSIRFKIELILQAIKSRGFFTIEAIAEIDRIKKYSASAYTVIKQMCDEGILSPRNSTLKGEPTKFSRQDYSLAMNDFDPLVAELLETTHISPKTKMNEWIIKQQDGQFIAKKNTVSYTEFFVERFNEIISAPEIEVLIDAHPSTLWMFKNPTPLTSITKLIQATIEIFYSAFQEAGRGKITLSAVWTTGEWIFCNEGWACETIGKNLITHMNNKLLKMNLILSRTPTEKTLRQTRSNEVLDQLKKPIQQGSCNVVQLDWWQHNRVLTLLEWQNKGRRIRKGIYMRRRLATPLVSPVRVDQEDCGVLQDIFDRYKEKAE